MRNLRRVQAVIADDADVDLPLETARERQRLAHNWRTPSRLMTGSDTARL